MVEKGLNLIIGDKRVGTAYYDTYEVHDYGDYANHIFISNKNIVLLVGTDRADFVISPIGEKNTLIFK